MLSTIDLKLSLNAVTESGYFSIFVLGRLEIQKQSETGSFKNSENQEKLKLADSSY